MGEIKDRAARDKIVRARTNLLLSNGFFGFLCMQLKLVEVQDDLAKEITTMAVDGIHLYYNTDFVHKLDDRECEGVLCHEVMHCAFQHFSRRGHRDPRGWNIAGDFVINLDLVASGFKLPGTPISLAFGMDPKNMGVKGHLLDPQFKGMSTEDVYERLPKITVKFCGGGGKDDPGGCGGVLDAPGDSGKEDASEKWDQSVRIAIETVKASNPGSIPGSLQRLIEQLEKPKISWRDKTRNFIDQSMSKDVSWARINRRSVGIGALMPGYVSDRLNHLVFVADISGSINFKMLTEMLSEVAGALDEGTADHMSVVYADTHVRHVDEYWPGDIVKAKTFDGGGTDFADSFRWIKENAPDASCVVYLTDLQVSNFGEDPGCPVLWAVYSPDSLYDQLADRVPFGMPIQVSNSIG